MKPRRRSISTSLTVLTIIGGLAAGCGSSHTTSDAGPVTLASLTVTPSNVPLGVTATGRVTLIKAAAGSTIVSLSASDASISIPASVTIGTGSSAVDFPISTVSVGTAIITASLDGDTRTAGVNVVASTVPLLSGITLANGTVVGGTSVEATATLTLPAAAGGAVVMLSSNRSQATVPASVTIAAGATSANFIVTTTAVTTGTTATIAGTYAGGTQSASLSLTPATLAAAFTVRSNAPSPVTNSCPLAVPGTALTCTFDGSASTGLSIASYEWSYVMPSSTSPTTLHQTTSVPTLSNPPVTCAFFAGATPTAGSVSMTVTLVVVDSSGTSSTATQNIGVSVPVPSGTCGF
jgi:hypothetical protein